MSGKWLNQRVILRVLTEEYSDLYVDGLICPCDENLVPLQPYRDVIRVKGGSAAALGARKFGPLPLGEAVTTPGGGLLAEYVIHVALQPATGAGGQSDSEAQALIEEGVANCLYRAHEMGFITVGIPFLSPVFPQLTEEQCAGAMLQSIERTIGKLEETSIWEVVIQTSPGVEFRLLERMILTGS